MKEYFKNNQSLFLILFIALIIRLVWIFFVPNVQVSDALYNKLSAINLAETHTYFYQSYYAYSAPGYPFLLSLFYQFGNIPDSVIKLFQILLSVSSIALLYSVCLTLANKKSAIASAWFYALYLNPIAYCSLFLTEVFFTFVLLLYVRLWLLPHTKLRALYLGLTLAALTYIKPQGMLLGLILGIYFYATQRTAFKTFILHFSIAILLVSFWMIRNYFHVGRFTLSTNAAKNLFIGNNDHASGKYEDYGLLTNIDEKEQMKYYADQLHQHLMPIEKYPGLLASKFIYFFITDAESIRYWTYNGIAEEKSRAEILNWQWFCLFEYLLIIAGCSLALYGIILGKYSIPFLFFIPLIFFLLLQLIFFGDARFHFPAMPFLLPVAALGWIRIITIRDSNTK